MENGYKPDVPLAPRTTLGLGGRARLLRDVRSRDELIESLRFADAERLPVHVLGGGSNVVFPDAGFPGLVIGMALEGVEFHTDDGETEIAAAAGVEWDAVVRAAIERGLTGIECLSGIPGLVGAAPMQNVGAYGQQLSDSLVHVDVLDRDTLEQKRLSAGECELGYRWSRFKGPDRDRFVILGLALRLRGDTAPRIRYPELARALPDADDLAKREPAGAVRAVRRAVLGLRAGKSMLVREGDPESRSAGSFFLNPVLSPSEFEGFVARAAELGIGRDEIPVYPAKQGVKVSAAWLVERAGFEKGHRHGGVGISKRHALALVNRGGTAAELLDLAREIREAVHTRFGVRLEPEPVIVPGEAPLAESRT